MAAVVLERVSKSFGATRAVDRVSLEVRDGEFFTLLGPSGCGKTTLLRLVAGLEQADAGAIRIGDREVTHLPPPARRIAMVFQNYALYPHLTIAENISYPLRLRRVPAEEIARKVQTVAAKLQIAHLLSRRPAQISGGQQQRTAVARAMVQDPRVYLFDEPLSNLDFKLRLEARRFLKRLQRETGVTALYVTHDQTEAMALSDRVAVLKDGKVIQVAAPEEIYRRPADTFVAGFIGAPAMNLVEGRVEGRWFVSGNFRLELKGAGGPAAGAKATLGIRPEHLELAPAGAGVWDGVIDDVEPLGAERMVTVLVAEVPFLVRMLEPTPVKPGEPVSVRFDDSALNWFGPDDRRLSCGI